MINYLLSLLPMILSLVFSSYFGLDKNESILVVCVTYLVLIFNILLDEKDKKK